MSRSSYHQFDIIGWIPFIIYGTICFLILLSGIVFLCYQFWCKSSESKIESSIKAESLLTLLCFMIAIIFENLYLFFVKIPELGDNISVISLNFYTVTNTFWSIGYFCTYLLFWKRMDSSFRGTFFEITIITKYLFFFILCTYLFSQIVNSVIWIKLTLGMPWDIFNKYYHWMLWLRLVSDFLLNSIIIYLFCSKIYKLTIEHNFMKAKQLTKRTMSSSPTLQRMPTKETRSIVHNAFNESDTAMFDCMIKYFYLSSLTIISTQIFTAAEIGLSFGIETAENDGKFIAYYNWYKAYYALRSTDSIVTAIYIILTFRFTETWYRVLCRYFHIKCVNIWEKLVKSGVETRLKLTLQSVDTLSKANSPNTPQPESDIELGDVPDTTDIKFDDEETDQGDEEEDNNIGDTQQGQLGIIDEYGNGEEKENVNDKGIADQLKEHSNIDDGFPDMPDMIKYQSTAL